MFVRAAACTTLCAPTIADRRAGLQNAFQIWKRIGSKLLAGDTTQTARDEALQTRLRVAGPWFHNLRIQGIETAPDHSLGDYPSVKWRSLSAALPEELTGKSVLDIGCNAGFYSIELKRRHAGRVLGIDTEEMYLNQARIARDELALEIDYRNCSAYDVLSIEGQFDIVLFMGLFYHLRYPLYALDRVVQKIKPGGTLVFQTLFRPHAVASSTTPIAPDYPFWEEPIFTDPAFPQVRFFEHSFAGDKTNWWIPNRQAVEAMLRSAGLRIDANPEQETWLCTPVATERDGQPLQQLEFAGKLW